MKPGSLDHWRTYFRSTANPDIFEIIEKAILVAAADCPKEFRSRRDRIAEVLFSCRLSRCSGCHRDELAVPEDDENRDAAGVDGDDIVDIDGEGDDDDDDGVGGGASSKGNKVVSSNRGGFEDDEGEVSLDEDDDDHHHLQPQDGTEKKETVSNYSYGDAEALTDEIEEVSQVVGEVFRIKDILLNSRDESDSVLHDCLRRLELMALTVDTLKATEIGKAVNRLRKHNSEEIRCLARVLIDGWKDLVDEWCSASQAIRVDEGTPESLNPSTIDEEEGLPSPPLDLGALFATQPTGLEWSQFFDGMDDDGNPRNSGEFMKKHGNGRILLPDNQNSIRRKPHPTNNSNVLGKERMTQHLKGVASAKPNNKHSNAISGPGKSLKPNAAPKAESDFQLQQKVDKTATHQKLLGSKQQKLNCSNDVAVQRKLEATKRKLQESYQQAENAKKQRTIKVMEFHDLPKQGPMKDNLHMRSGNFNRNRMHGRS